VCPTVHDEEPEGPARFRLPTGPVLTEPVLTGLAVATLLVPFAIILIRFAVAGDSGVTLPDDLALVDLHTRAALHFQQVLGPFDRFGWNHPGPTYYYLLSLPYRVLGSGPAAAFFGATLINLLAALGVVWVCRRRVGPLLALGAALVVGILEIVLSINSAAALTYSEGALGAAVSPWTATVVIVPLLLFAVLCAAATTPSPLSALGALLVGSLVVQTDFSAAPLVVVLLVLSLGAGAVAMFRDHRAAVERVRPSRRWPAPLAAGLGAAVFVVMWIPPLVQNATTHPGNLDLIYRFFTASHPIHPLSQGLKAVVSVDAVAFLGPGEIMSTVLGNAPAHGLVAGLAVAVFVVAGVVAVAGGLGRRDRFAAALGALSLAGLVAMVFAVARITGLIYGYLVLWEIVLPALAVLGLGAVFLSAPSAPRSAAAGSPAAGSSVSGRSAPSHRHRRASPAWGPALVGALAVVTGVVLCVRMVALPALSAVSDPAVGAVVARVTPALPHAPDAVFVGDEGLSLIGTEEFIGVVNQLDRLGDHPKVNSFWLTEFGSRYVADPNHIAWHVGLLPWSARAPRLPGYVGRVGTIAVTVARTVPTHR
jgi:hypothetical protein